MAVHQAPSGIPLCRLELSQYRWKDGTSKSNPIQKKKNSQIRSGETPHNFHSKKLTYIKGMVRSDYDFCRFGKTSTGIHELARARFTDFGRHQSQSRVVYILKVLTLR